MNEKNEKKFVSQFLAQEIEEVFAEESNRGVDLDASRVAEDGAEIYAEQPYRTEQHHWFPQQYREKFEEIGIDPDQFTTDIDRDSHQTVIHLRSGEIDINQPWKDFFAANPSPTYEETVEFAKSVQAQFGYEGAEMHVYNKHQEETSFDVNSTDEDISNDLEYEVDDSADEDISNDLEYEVDDSADEDISNDLEYEVDDSADEDISNDLEYEVDDSADEDTSNDLEYEVDDSADEDTSNDLEYEVDDSADKKNDFSSKIN
jgi:Predicted lipoprotein of unknown function (DUF2380)